MKSYLSPKIKLCKSRIVGSGLFVKQKISKNEIVIDYEGGAGRLVTKNQADILWKEGIDYDLQIDENLFFVGNRDEIEEVDFLNHSCDPNCGIKDRFKIVAMRDIEPDEEITFDYAMSESYYYSMRCLCGSEKCRKIITGDDWKILDLWKRYNNFFSYYLQKKIKSMSL